MTGDFSLRRRLMTERNSEGKSVTISNFAPLLHPSISDGRGKFVCGGGLRRRISLREGEKRKGKSLSYSVVQGFNSIVQTLFVLKEPKNFWFENLTSDLAVVRSDQAMSRLSPRVQSGEVPERKQQYVECARRLHSAPTMSI